MAGRQQGTDVNMVIDMAHIMGVDLTKDINLNTVASCRLPLSVIYHYDMYRAVMDMNGSFRLCLPFTSCRATTSSDDTLHIMDTAHY